MWSLPRPGIEPTALALAGGFLTLYHQGSPVLLFFFFNLATLSPSWRLMWDLVPRPGIEPRPPAFGSVESRPLDHQGSPSFTFLILRNPWLFVHIYKRRI